MDFLRFMKQKLFKRQENSQNVTLNTIFSQTPDIGVKYICTM